MRGVNKVMLVGRLGADPDPRFLPSGATVALLRIATNEVWKKNGEQKQHTEWHSVLLFDRLAEIATEYLKKGSMVYIEGRLRTRKWQDKNGNDRYTTEIVASSMQMLGGGRTTEARPESAEAPQEPTVVDEVPEYDDIPF